VLGRDDGCDVGSDVGCNDGCDDGCDVGDVGFDVGSPLGCDDGVLVGATVGLNVGSGTFALLVITYPTNASTAANVTAPTANPTTAFLLFIFKLP